MKATTAPSGTDGQLTSLYCRWTNNRATHGSEVVDTIDRIIHRVLNTSGLEPIYRRYEDKEDLVQDLRLLCLKCLDRVQNPTNKRLFNFLRVTVSLALLDKSRKVGKLVNREKIEKNLLGEIAIVPTACFCFGDDTMDFVAAQIAFGETKEGVRAMLDVSRGDLDIVIDNIKKSYLDYD